jgi:hypothetical protein
MNLYSLKAKGYGFDISYYAGVLFRSFIFG